MLIEYCRGKGLFVAVNSDAVPRKGETVQILRVDYQVKEVFWTVDSSGTSLHQQRAIVELLNKQESEDDK